MPRPKYLVSHNLLSIQICTHVFRQGLVNLLVVTPDSILPLVDGTLRLDHREALKYVRLRQDFNEAIVDGKSLLQLLTSADSDPAHRRQR
jgi:hypothetical protein